jgi:lambda family phage portal protein
MNPLDQFIAGLSPQAAVKRQRARLQLDALRRYDGAARGRRTDGWRTQGTSADAAASLDRATLRDRSRDLVRNNPYAAKAVGVIVSNVIGTGIIAQAKAQRSRRRSQQLTDLWHDWASVPQQCDFNGRHDFYGLQALAMRCIVESGEVLIRRRTPGSRSNQRIPLQLQVMEPDMLDTGRDGALENNGLIHEGIEYDANGRRTAYYLFEEHPGERHMRVTNIRSSRVPADEVIHVYRQDRPHQTRGIPWASPVIIRLRDYDDYSDAQLLKQKISACFAGFLVDTEAPDAGPSELIDKLEPGALEILPPGKDIRFASPPSVGEFGQITREYLLQIAAGFGVTYEALTGDLSHVNFSSARLGWLEFQRNIEAWRWQMLVPQMLNPIWSWFVGAGSVAGARLDGIVAHWTPPRRELIDPSKEIEATKKAVRCGFISLSEAIREFGYEPEEILEEIKSDNDTLDTLGLVLDTDPRQVSGNGQREQGGDLEEGDVEATGEASDD